MEEKDVFDGVDLGLDDPIEGLEDRIDESDFLKDDSTATEDYDNFLDSSNTSSVLDSLLINKGIVDGKIKIVDEDGSEEEISFYDLSAEEQLDILNSDKVSDIDLDNSEIEFLNLVRTSGLTPSQYLDQYKQQILSELNQEAVQTYDIDNYTDQELYVLDLKNKFDLTEEELVAELEKELQNETLFTRKVTKLREEYKALEDEYKEAQTKELESQREQQYNQFAQQMVDVAIKTEDFYGIELEDTEKNEVLSFLLELDENGTSNFYKSLNDPQKLYEAAWFLRYGKEAFETLKNVYESEISKLKKEDKRKVVVRKDNNKINTIHDLNY